MKKSRHKGDVPVKLRVDVSSIEVIKESIATYLYDTRCTDINCNECMCRMTVDAGYSRHGCFVARITPTIDTLKWLIENKDYWEKT